MKRSAVLLAALACATLPASAAADPTHNTAGAVLAACDNGQEVLLNFGTQTNHSHQTFVIGSSGSISASSIYVVKYLAFTGPAGTTVAFDTEGGVESLVTCEASLFDITITSRGFFTSRGVAPPVKTSRQLCFVYGGAFGSAPDEVGALSDPVLWVCNDITIPFDVDSFQNRLQALGADCAADGGAVVEATALSVGTVEGTMEATCYAPATVPAAEPHATGLIVVPERAVFRSR
jgi:hypothetical protein